MSIKKTAFSKKSQAAIEFLSTYGWAFIVILIMIGALSYFGILSPSKLFPNNCKFGSIDCREFTIYKNGLQLILKNTLGEPAIIDEISALTDKGVIVCNSSAIGSVWKSGDIKEVPVICSNFSGVDILGQEKVKLRLKVTFHPVMSSSLYSKEVTGYVYSAVQDDLVPSTALAGSWHFDEGSGTQSSDSSGNNNGLNVFNGAQWVPGKIGTALSFDGLGAFAEIPDSPMLDIQNAGTIEAWIKLNEVTGKADQNMIVNKDWIMYEMAVHDNTGPENTVNTCGKSTDQIPTYNLAFYFCGLSGLPSHNCGWTDGGGTIPKNIWIHIAVTYDGSKVRTYINGAMKKEYTGISGNVCTNNVPVRIGSRGGYRVEPNGSVTVPLYPPPQTDYGALFNGAIDEVKIYNRALTDQEILRDSSI